MSKFFKIALLTIIFTLSSTSAFAHSELISTDPEDGAVITQLPENFVVTYNEDLIADGTFAVLVIDGVATDLMVEVVANQVFIAIDPNLESGVYRVEFKTVAADGHPQEGAINFTYAILEEAPVTEGEESPSLIAPAPTEEIDVVIDQPTVEETSNPSALWAAGAIVIFAALLLLRIRSKNKG